MYWIQEMGQVTGANRLDFKLYYAETLDDLNNRMPNLTDEGDINYATDGCEEYTKKLKIGDQCMVLEDTSVWVLKSDNTWTQI